MKTRNEGQHSSLSKPFVHYLRGFSLFLFDFNNVFRFLSCVLQALGMLCVLLLISRTEQTVEKAPLTGWVRI